MSYRGKRRYRYAPSRFRAFASRGGNVRRRTKISRGNEQYGGAVYRYAPQVNPRSADMKWMVWVNDHQGVYIGDSSSLSKYEWGNQNNNYGNGTATIPIPYLSCYGQSKYVYLDDPWYCPLISTGGSIWNKRVSSAIMIKKLQCCFAIRPIQFQIPAYFIGSSGPTSQIGLGSNKFESLINGTFRWWLILDTQCNGTRLIDYQVGPITTEVTATPSYIFDKGNGFVSTMNDLNRGRFSIVAVKDFEVCGKCSIAAVGTEVITLFTPYTKQYDFSMDVNIPLEWSSFSSTHNDSDTTYTTNRLIMVGAFITSQGFQYPFYNSFSATDERTYIPYVDPAMMIKTYFVDI